MIFSHEGVTKESFDNAVPMVHRYEGLLGWFRKVKCNACNHDVSRMVTKGSMFKIFEYHRCERCGDIRRFCAAEY